LTKTTNQEDEKMAIWDVLTTRMIVVSHTVTGTDGKKSTRDYIKLQKNIHTGETPELALQKKVRADTNIKRILGLYGDTIVLGVRLTPLSAAIYANDQESADILLDHLLPHIGLGEVDTRGRNALHMAAKYGCSLPLFHRILNSIYDVNAGNNWKMTALMFAVNNKHLELVTVLMKYPGINLNFQGNFSQTALHYAVKIASPAIVAQLLSDSSIDTSLKDSEKRTPLMLAFDMGRDECVKILKEHEASEE
jgi:ankyrin repeat protein